MMDRAQKAQVIDSLVDRLDRASAAFVVDFKGMNVEQVTNLRKTLTGVDAEMKVVRNTLAKRALAAKPENEEAISNTFVGTNAFVFAFGDASAPAKALVDFSKEVEHLEIKAGVMDGAALDEERIKYLGNLPSKDVLRAQLLGVLNAPATKLVGTLAAVPGGFARLLNAYKEKQS